jgi:DNA-binding GntR family transcriptional regulator
MAKASSAPGRKGTGTQRAYERLRDRILNLELRPGQNLDEREFVHGLGVSRTPVREALIRLAGEGLVDLLPNRGARVSEVDLSRVREFFEALDVNQRMATRWAALRRTPADLERIDRMRLAFEDAARTRDVRALMDTNLDFHVEIARACGNTLVERYYTHLLTFGLRISRIALLYEGPDPTGNRPEHIAQIVVEHRQMVADLRSGDADAAERVARAHTETFRRRVLEYVSHSLSDGIAV